MKSYRGSNQHLKNKLRLSQGKIHAQIYNWTSSLILGTKMLHLRCLTWPPLCNNNSYFWIFLQKNLSWGPFFGKVVGSLLNYVSCVQTWVTWVRGLLHVWVTWVQNLHRLRGWRRLRESQNILLESTFITWVKIFTRVNFLNIGQKF